MTGWTAQTIEHAVKRHAAGTSAGVIAKELGRTRGSVIGKLFRLKAPNLAGGRIRLKRKSFRKLVDPVAVAEMVVRRHKISIAELDYHSCRWPMWKNDAEPSSEKLYCGAYAEIRPYCAAHIKRSTRPW